MEQFEALGIRNVAFSHGLVQALLAGQILYNNPGCPSNLSIFTCFEQEGVMSDAAENSLFLHLVASEGRGKTNEDIRKMTKQTVRVPMDLDEVLSQTNILRGLLQILLGKGSIATDEVRRLKEDLDEYKAEIKAAMAGEKDLASKICYAVDIRLQRWLTQCKRARDRADVNDSILNFGGIIEDILNNKSICNLPATFFRLEKEVTSTSDGGREQKKRKVQNKRNGQSEEDERVFNKKPIDEFKCKGEEDWKLLCKAARHKPSWPDPSNPHCKMCHRFHSKQYCFPDCKNKASHVPREKVPDEKHKEYNAYLKRARGS